MVVLAITSFIYEKYKCVIENRKRKRDGFVLDGVWYNYNYFDQDDMNLIIKPGTCLTIEHTK